MENKKGRIIGISTSEKRGTRKYPVDEIEITKLGLKGDAHAGNWERQVSLLAKESVERYFPGKKIEPGYYSENLLVEGINLHQLPIGTKLKINSVELEVTKIGKDPEEFTLEEREWRKPMLIEGIFTKVNKSGMIKIGDQIEIL
ncbi:MAG: MOSC domain-containing protein [Candidatus Heimdallarchaeaceae archaeon]